MLGGLMSVTPKPAVKEFSVEFNTGSGPPNKYYRIQVKATVGPKDVDMHYTLNYLYNKGEPTTDDLQWDAKLSDAWCDTIDRLARDTTIAAGSTPAADSRSLTIDLHRNDGKVQKGVPSNALRWQTFVEDVSAAARVAKSGDRILPFRYGVVDKSGGTDIHTIDYEAITRSVHGSRENKKVNVTHPLTLDDYENLRMLFARVDYVTLGTGNVRLPSEPGEYVDNGSGYWFSLTDGVHDAPGNAGTKAQLAKTFAKLTNY